MSDDDITRRDILGGLGGLAVAGAVGCSDQSDAESYAGVAESALGTCAGFFIDRVENAEQDVPDVMGYTTVQGSAQKSVAAGEAIEFRISSPVDYDLSIVRLGWDPDSTTRDWVLATFPLLAAPQKFRPGSYIWVPQALSPSQPYPKLTLECWVRPSRTAAVGSWQGLITQYAYSGQAGFGLFLDPGNLPVFYFGNGGDFDGNWIAFGSSPLTPNVWHHLVVVFDSGTAKLYVDGGVGPNHDPQVTKTGLPSAVLPGTAPLRIGAYGDSTGTAQFLDGDIAMPEMFSGVLSPATIFARWSATHPPRPYVPDPDEPNGGSIIGCWELKEEGGVTVRDTTSCARHGVIVNHGTWMIGGPTFNAGAVSRFDNQYDPQTPATQLVRGNGLRLSGSDLYDCKWDTAKTFTIPSDARPGLYVGRITYLYNGNQQHYDITFVVRRATSRPRAPIVVLAATNTWMAYNKSLPDRFSFYQNPVRPSGQPTYYQGLNMPWAPAPPPPEPPALPPAYEEAVDPLSKYYPAFNYSHLVRAERYMHTWLDRNGYDYDVVSDADLHADPSLLLSYKALIITGHSEYWTKEAWGGVKSYLAAGGKVIVASGNTMFWRVSTDGAVIECRKAGGAGGFNELWGENYHEHDKKRGGLMREAGCPGYTAIGLESIGFRDPPLFEYQLTPDGFSPTNVPTHPFLTIPELIPSISPNSPIGGLSVGHEFDVRVQQMPGGWNPNLFPGGTSPSGVVVPLAQAFGTNAVRWTQTGEQTTPDGVVSEIIDWQQTSGGRVFAAGSIAVGKALESDDKLARMFRNVLHADGVVVRATALWIGTDGHLRQRRHDGTTWLPFNSATDDLGTGFGTNPPIGVQWAPNSISAMAVLGGVFKYRWDTGAGWAPWNDFTGASFAGRPAAVGWGRNRINLFARSTGNRLLEKAWDGVNWSGWTDAGGSAIAGAPSAVSFQGTKIGVAARNSTGNILFREKVDNTWSAFTNLGETFVSNPTLHCWSGNRLAVFGVKSNGHCLVKMRTGANWSAEWTDLEGTLAGRVQIGTLSRDLFVVYGIGTDGRMKLKWFDGVGTFQPTGSAWTDTLGGNFTGEPASISFRSFCITLMAVTTGGVLQHNTFDGANWSDWQQVATGARPSPGLFSWISS